MKKNIILGIVCMCLPIFAFAQSSNIGIIDGIWFSTDDFFANDPLRIYTAIQNNSGQDIQGTVEFFDNDISLGKKDFTALDRRISELWIDTIITAGEHNYSVSITEASVGAPGQEPQDVTPRIIRSEDTLVAELDSDGDDVGDEEDPDDDNDGFSDEEELADGTDPLDKSSVPVVVEVTSDSSGGLIQDLVRALSSRIDGSNEDQDQISESSDPDLGESVSPGENNSSNQASVEREQEVALPVFVEKIQDQFPVAEKVTTPLNAVQNVLVPRIEKERKRVQDSIREKEINNTIRDQEIQKKRAIDSVDSDTRDIQQVATAAEGTRRGFSYWISLLYSYLLRAMSFIFSCLVCMIILIFLSLHIFLKIIFKIFSRRER